MNREDIIRMAREAGIHFGGHPMNPLSAYVNDLERFAALVAAAEQEKMMDRIRNIIVEAEERGAAAEREACAKVCDGWDFVPGGHEFTPQQLVKNVTETIAHNIRARGQA